MKEWLLYRIRKGVGYLFSRKGKTGHNLLCRFITLVCDSGPSGTFCYADRYALEVDGGYVCTFATRCGKPTKEHMRQMNEELERFHVITELLRDSGGLVSFIAENPRFAVSVICSCGQPENPRLPEHDPLCEYRIRWHMPVTIEEYREAIGASSLM